ncbi:MAG TPA: DNA polymerase III subunit chi [Gammaproteobacteria bacterium]|nr:DNA polymerase III subunit chi [Gammaproteobacteria bacterium]
MPRIDFYVLKTAEPRERALFACRLAEKAFTLGHTVYIHTPSVAEAQSLDDLLWTWRDRSFVPHALAQEAGGELPPVVIGSGSEPPAAFDLLINLDDGVPAFFERFARVAEIVDEDGARRAAGRERFRFYRERGYAPETHTL